MQAPTPHPLAHHVSKEAARRQNSLLKAMYKYMILPDMKSLGGGLPHPSLFPVRKVTYDILAPPECLDADDTCRTTQLRCYDDETARAEGVSSTVSLTVAQQYASGAGLPQLTAQMDAFMRTVHSPPVEAGHEVALTLGNTDAVAKAMRLLLNPGDNCLFEEFTFPAPVENARAMGVGLVPVPLDAEGISPTAIDEILTNWSTENFGPKPRVLYTITVGQNPTGSTPGLERLQALYAVAQKHDLILIEDDPYALVQLGPYARGRSSAIRKADSGYSSMVATPVDGLTGRPSVDNSLVSFKHTLSRSLLSLDVDGRVIRTDSFSKVIFPGSRFGTITLNSLFRERYERITEVTTQSANGLGQAFFAELFTPPTESNGAWGMTGLVAWINKVRRAYISKRDFFLDVLNREISPSLDLISFTPPEAGMFCWMQIHLEKHARYTCDNEQTPRTNTTELMQELFDLLIAEGCLMLPGKFFSVPHLLPAEFEPAKQLQLVEPIEDRSHFLRATFAGSEEEIEAALCRFAKVLKQFFQVQE